MYHAASSWKERTWNPLPVQWLVSASWKSFMIQKHLRVFYANVEVVAHFLTQSVWSTKEDRFSRAE